MKINYQCAFTFSDPNNPLFNHKEVINIILPVSTYTTVKEYAFKEMSKLKVDIPKEYSKIDFEIIDVEEKE